MGESHECKKKPYRIDIYRADNGWTLGIFDCATDADGVYVGSAIRIGIDYCPFCGERLESEDEALPVLRW